MRRDGKNRRAREHRSQEMLFKNNCRKFENSNMQWKQKLMVVGYYVNARVLRLSMDNKKLFNYPWFKDSS